ncbi:ABC transporter permease [candidate division KSB1 bacterium]|nr:ABC transporter permease [candidate division KSB1 bacterium]
MLRSLKYFWRIQLAVMLGAATATAVLTGALLVGDSVRGSLRDLTLDRLGKIDYTLLSENLFREELALDLSEQVEYRAKFDTAVPALLLTGTMIQTATKSRATGVNICGVDERFAKLFGASPDSLIPRLARRTGQPFPSVIINAALQQELNAKVGDQVLLAFKSYSEIPRASLLGNKEAEDVLASLRLTVTHILPNCGLGRFGLRPQQHLPRNAFVLLPTLQRALAQEGKVNALLVAAKGAIETQNRPMTTPHLKEDAVLAHSLQANWQLADLGLRLQTHDTFFSLTSRELILKPSIVALTRTLTHDLQLAPQPILTYLANTLHAHGRMVPYSTITALPTPVPAPFGSLQLREGAAAPRLDEDGVLLNEWAAQELQATVGDTVLASYYVVGAREELATQTHPLRVRGIVQQKGLAADRTLTPPIPGVENAEDMHAWEPPFPVNLKLIRPQDEVYWDEHGATPKAFVNDSTGRRLWRSRFGEVSALRFAANDRNDLSKLQAEFEKRLLSTITPEAAGFNLQSVKAQGLQAAAGATDFGMLFIGFSIFLIASATLLLGMLFRLGVEQRAREVGTLLAMGYSLRSVRGRLFKEGMLIALLGTLLGTLGALSYAWLMMIGLRTWWVEAVGTSFLFLHVAPASLIIGALCALVIIACTIWWTVRQLGKIPATALLHGVTQRAEVAPIRYARMAAVSASALAMLLFLLALAMDSASSAGLFFGSGALLLIAGLALLSMRLRRRRTRAIITTRFAMSARNNARNPGRSMLSAALVACACFIIVAVGANRREFGREALQKNSGSGGFALMAESDAPLHQNINSASGRAALGFSEEDSVLFQGSTIYPLRLLPGEDASCLNLYQPQKPRVLGVTREQSARGGFQFQATSAAGVSNPWSLLETETEPNVIPAIGDFNSVQWILHLGLGKDLVIQNERGEDLKLRFVALLHNSIFQSEILISEENFLKHFPGQSGYSHFLIETPPDSAARLSQVLESALHRYGFDATSTLEKLASFQAVENTYLSVFQTIGGLGLLLGTLGLGLILMRNVIERRGELATLRAFGFLQTVLMKMLLQENSFLLLWGILIGSGAALLAVAPHLVRVGSFLPWFTLLLTLLLVFLTGFLASALALKAVAQAPLLAALKEE